MAATHRRRQLAGLRYDSIKCSWLGLGLGFLVLHFRNDIMDALNRMTGMEMLPPELYQLSRLPALTTPHDVATVVVSVLVICTLAAVVPAWRAARLDPVEALRDE